MRITLNILRPLGKPAYAACLPLLPNFKLMLLCVQVVIAKGCPNFRKAREEKRLSGYKQCYTYKNQSLGIDEFSSRYVQQT